VIKSDGSIGGYGAEGILKKMTLLKREGIVVRKGFVNLREYEYTRFTWPLVNSD